MDNHSTYRICITDAEHVRVEKFDPNYQVPGKFYGVFRYKDNRRDRILTLHNQAVSENITKSEAEELGELLFESLFDDSLRIDFFNFFKQTPSKERVLRIELDVDERALPEITALPWEFLRNPDPSFGVLTLSTEPNLAFSRLSTSYQPRQSFQLRPSEYLRVVLAVAAPEEMPSVEFQKVKAAIEKLTRTEPVKFVHFIEHANRKKIDEALRQFKPHIFHFIGHGQFELSKGKADGRIVLENSSGYKDLVRAEQFAELFNRHRPGVVVLQACETASMDACIPFSGIAARMVAQNIPVVVAMRYKVSNMTAGIFAKAFYANLAENKPVDTAVQEGRRAIAISASETLGRDFATPVLFMGVPDGQLFNRPQTVTENIQKYIQKARQDEKNHNHLEALKKWKYIRQMEPGNTQVQTAILRLTEKNKILTDLAKRYNEIKPVYKLVVRYLKRMDKKGLTRDGKKFIDIVHEYLSGKISPVDFVSKFRQMEAKPARVDIEPKYDILADRLIHREIIPFIGSEILSMSGLSDLSAQKLSGVLAAGANYQGFEEPLSVIAQYCQMEDWGRGKLIRTIQDEFVQALQTCRSLAFYEALAEIKMPIIVVSACYDNTLENIFTQKKKPFIVVSHATNKGELESKMLVKYYNREKSEDPCTAENLSDYESLSKDYSIIYKIWGCLSMYDDPDDPMVLVENDFFSFARKIETLIPDFLTKRIIGRSILFLGHTIREWRDRLIINEIIKRDRSRVERSYTVIEQPDQYEVSFWKYNRTDIYWKNLNTFIDKLCNSIQRMQH